MNALFTITRAVFGSIARYEWFALLPALFIAIPFALVIIPFFNPLHPAVSTYFMRFLIVALCIPGVGGFVRRPTVWRRTLLLLPMEARRVRKVVWWSGAVIYPAVAMTFLVTATHVTSARMPATLPAMHWFTVIPLAICWTASVTFLDTLAIPFAAVATLSLMAIIPWMFYAPIVPGAWDIPSFIYVCVISIFAVAALWRNHFILPGPMDTSDKFPQPTEKIMAVADRVSRAPYAWVVFTLLFFVVLLAMWFGAQSPLSDGSKVVSSQQLLNGMTALPVMFSSILTMAMWPCMTTYRMLPLGSWRLCIRLVTPYFVLSTGTIFLASLASGALSEVEPAKILAAMVQSSGLSIFGAAIGFSCKRTLAGIAGWWFYTVTASVSCIALQGISVVAQTVLGLTLAVVGLKLMHYVITRSKSVYRTSIVPQIEFTV